MKNHRSTGRMLAYATLATIALWLIPGANVIALPLLYLNTIVHELCHALAGVGTGGSVHSIGVFSAGNGVTSVSGGIELITASAGYLGASLFGAGLIRAGSSVKGAKNMLVALGALIGIGLLFWIRADLVGITASLFWILALLGLGMRLKGDALLFTAQFLGLQQCAYSLNAVFVLLQINTVPRIENDALIASRIFPLPPLLYALAWTGISVGLVGLALFRNSSGSSSSKAE